MKQVKRSRLVDVLPLAPLQEGLLFHAQFDDTEPDVYSVQVVLRLTGPLDAAALRAAADALVERHTVLRSAFRLRKNGQAIQVVLRDVPARWSEADLSGPGGADEAEAELSLRLAAERGLRFDLTEPSAIRFTLYRLPGGKHVLTLTNHHILFDGWSGSILFRELFQLYEAGDRARLRPAVSLREYFAWLDAQDTDAALAAWLESLGGLAEPLRLGSGASTTSAGVTALPERIERTLSTADSARLVDFLRAEGLTLNTLVEFAWAVLLGHLTGRVDVVFGTTVSGRPPEIPGMESMVGLFINTLPVRVRLDFTESLVDNLRRVQREQAALLAHQHVNLAEIQRVAGLGELFDTATVVENFPPGGDDSGGDGTGLRVEGVQGNDSTHFALGMVAGQVGDQVLLRLDHRTDLYSADRAAELMDTFLLVLRAAATDPHRELVALDLLGQDRRTELLTAGAGRAVPGPPRHLADLFADQVRRTPHEPAVECAGRILDFAELNERANRLAHELVARGVGPESVVALAVSRSVEMVVALLAVQKAGGAYLPVDTGYPDGRIAFMLADSRPGWVLGTADTLARVAGCVPAGAVVDLLDLADDTVTASVAARPAHDPTDADRRAPVDVRDTAYVVYTSGSTGTPKGVLVTHTGLAGLVAHQNDGFDLGPGSRVLSLVSLSFDVSVAELCMGLLSGGCVVLAGSGLSGAELLAALRDHRITHARIPSSSILAGVPRAELPELRMMSVGGETPAADVVDFWSRDRLLVNGYGPSETTVEASFGVAAPGVPAACIGGPVVGVRLYVLDAGLRLAGRGVAGELFIGGPGVARGYGGRPGLTASRFVADPFAGGGARMYRTGDVVRWGVHGLEFVGRVDDQVKIRGFRVELGEVASVIESCPGVARGIAVLREDTPGDKRIVGYAVGDGIDDVDVLGVREWVAARLPGYMVPSAVVELTAIPLTVNGKVDREALPEPDYGAPGGGRAPRTQGEEIVRGLFAEVLGVPEVSIDDSFFDLGGHSLLATRLTNRIRAVFEVEVGVRQLFDTPTVAGLHDAIVQAGAGRERLRPASRPDRIPLSFAQRRVWFLHTMQDTGAALGVPLALRLRGDLRADLLAAAIGDVVARHESLRTLFPTHEGVPHQVVLPAERAVPVLETRAVTEAALPAALAHALAHRFDLAAEPPLRSWLFRLGERESVLLVLTHHVATDGWSLGPLLRDLTAAYGARLGGVAPDLPPLPVQYADYTLWQQSVLGDYDNPHDNPHDDPHSQLAAQVDYWRKALRGAPALLELPTDRPRPAVASNRGASVEFAWDVELHRAVVDLAKETGTTPFIVVQAALAAMLGALGAGTDIPIGTAVAGRTDDALDDLVGFFINTLVLRTDLSGDPTFRQLLLRAREADLEAYANQEAPFERLVEVLNPDRSLAYHPLFQVMLTFQNIGDVRIELPGVAITGERMESTSARMDLSFTVQETHGADREPTGFVGAVEYATDLFDEDTVTELAQRLRRVLHAATADPSVRVGRLDVLGERERHAVLRQWNDTAHPVAPRTVVELIAEHTARTPDATAVIAAGTTLTYRELDERATVLASYLIDCGVGPERFVGLALPKSVDLAVAVLGVLKAGAGYLPLDTGHPDERVAFMLDDVRPALVLTDPDQLARLVRVGGGVRVVTFDAVPVRARATPPVGPAHRNAAFVIYTSGSTGRPKGVVVQHDTLNTYLAWCREAYDSLDGRALVHSPISFDLTATAFLGPLTAGGEVELVELDDSADSPVPSGTPAFVKATPSHLPLLTVLPADYSPSRQLVLGGESLMGEVLDQWRRANPDTVVLNEYGPTETTVGCSTFRIDPGQAVDPGVITIGRPIWNTQMYVLDAALRPSPIGVTGELYIAGDLVTRGYHNRAGLTGNRFVANPYGPAGARMYRSGDLARWRADGNLEFVSRADDQVKIRGFRIELGEIESVLGQFPGVREVAVIVREDVPGDKRLFAYVAAAATHPTVEQLRAHAVARLPEYMVPSVFVPLEEIPRTANHKLDRRNLPDAPAVASAAGRAPRTATERLVAAVFADVLGVPDVDALSNFFELGGHSLLATRVVARLRAELDTEVSLRILFESPTVADLAERLCPADTPDEPAAAVVESVVDGPMASPRPDRVPLAMAQRRLWFLHRLDPDSPAYNIPLAMRLHGQLDVPALRAAAADLAGRHEILRTWFPEDRGEPRQDVRAVAEPVVELVDATGSTAAELTDRLSATARYCFRLETEDPWRLWVYRVGPDEHVLMVVLHHIASDGSSTGPLLGDLAEAYRARTAGERPRWRPLPLQYADHAVAELARLGSEDDENSLISRQLRHWETTLVGAPELLELPVDRPRPARASHRGDVVAVSLDADLHHAVLELATRSRASAFMVAQAALAVLLCRLGAGTDVPVGTVVAGREEENLDQLVGFFTNTLVLRTDVGGDPTFTDLVERVRRTDLAAFENQSVSFERLVESLHPVRSLGHHPLFQVMLAYQHAADGGLPGFGGLRAEDVEFHPGVAKTDLAVSLVERRSGGEPVGIDGIIEFATDLFDRDTALALGRRFAHVLRAAVADPDRPVSELDALLPDEPTALLARGTGAPAPTPEPFGVLFERQAGRTPDAPAVDDGDTVLTYAALDRRANQLARYLVQRGAGPERVVALALPRGVLAVLAILAIHKAGAAHLAVDTQQPADRIRFMLGDAAPALVLTDSDTDTPAVDVPVIPLDDPLVLGELGSLPDGSLGATVPSPHSAAYMVYTSGSTGTPKGVVVSHAGLAGMVAHQHKDFRLGPGSRVLSLVSLSFDVSVAELCMALLSGGCMVLAGSALTGEDLLAALRDHRITHAMIPSSSILAGVPRAELPELRMMSVGGETPAADVVDFWSRDRLLVNCYGPSEATVEASFSVAGPEVPAACIGDPIAGVCLYVLDAGLRLVAPGVAGELFIGGAGVARGYAGRPGLSASRFVADPFAGGGARMYRTGDVVRWGVHGLEFVGRVDDQVKIRGFRVELGEVASVIESCPGVARGIAVVREDTPGDKRIVGYVVGDGIGSVDVRRVREWVAARLPGYMVPSAVVEVAAIPLSVNGKVDREALPEPDYGVHSRGRPPRTQGEEIVCGLFAEVLGVPEVSIDDSFFDLGGHSLLATKLTSRIREVLGLDFGLADLFERPTVAGLLVAPADGEKGPGAFDVLLPLRENGSGTPLFCVHPVSGLAWCYGTLLRGLDPDRRVYGLQAPGLDGEAALADSLVQQTDAYIQRILEVQPNGPYHLLGWSTGGNLAQSLATRLQERGFEVRTLILLDAYPEDEDKRGPIPAADILRNLHAGYANQFGESTERAAELSEAELRADIVEFFARGDSELRYFDADRRATILGITVNNVQLTADYTPRVFRGELTVIVATQERPPWAATPDYWERYVDGNVESYDVDSRHDRMMRPAGIGDIGRIVESKLKGKDQ